MNPNLTLYADLLRQINSQSSRASIQYLRYAFCIGYGIATSTPYYESSKAFSENAALSQVYGASDLAALIFFNSWLMDSVISSLSKQIQHIDNRCLINSTFRLTPILFMAALSAIPNTMVTYKTNSHKALAILAFSSDTVTGVFSYSELVSKLKNLYLHGIDHAMEVSNLSFIFQQGLKVLLKQQKRNQDDFSQFLSSEVGIQQLMGRMLSQGTEQYANNENNRSFLLRYSSPIHPIISSIVSLGAPIPWLYTLNVITRSALEEYGIGSTASLVVSLFPTVPVGILGFILINNLYSIVLDLVNDALDGYFFEGVGFYLSPILYPLCKLTVGAIMTLSFGTIGTMVNQAFDDDQDLMLASVISLVVTLRLLIASDMIDRIMLNLSSAQNGMSSTYRKLVSASDGVINFLSTCSPQQLDSLKNDLNENEGDPNHSKYSGLFFHDATIYEACTEETSTNDTDRFEDSAKLLA